MDVRDKVLRALGQVADGVEVDDLGAGGLDVGVSKLRITPNLSF